ncbi:MAG: hypothetical protein GY842_08610 [bacterium]|nr:hypothetical protein [bacterium]
MTSVDLKLNCAVCDAPLATIEEDSVCGGCGISIDATLDPALLDPERRAVTTDVSCADCGYNLRTLSIESVCPECACPTVRSLHSTRLCFADPEWLDDLRRSVSMLLIVGVGIPTLILAAVLSPTLFPGLAKPAVVSATIVAGAALFVMVILAIGGVAGVSMEEDRQTHARSAHWPHTMGALFPVHVVLAVCVPLGLALLGSFWSWPWLEAVAVLLLFLLLLGTIASLFCATICLRRVALRADDSKLAGHTKLLTWLVVVSTVGGVLLFAMRRIPLSLPSSTWSMLAVVHLGICFVTMLVWLLTFVTGMAVLGSYRSLLRRVLKAQPRPVPGHDVDPSL